MTDIAHPKLDDEQLQIIESFGKLKSYKDGEMLMEAGKPAQNFHAILSGEVNIVDYSSGSPKIIATRTAREFTGNVSLLSGRAANVSMVAQGNVEAYEILPEQLRQIMNQKPALGNLIFTEFVARWQLAQEHHLTPVQVIGSRFSSDTFRIRDFLSKNRIFFTWIDI
jgi:thioredoxin reductase (NADPH)